MDRFDRIFTIHKILSSRKTPISHQELEEKAEASRSTITRTITAMRNYFEAPIEYDHSRNGYYYNQKEGEHPFEIPGLWFNSDELFALITTQKLLSDIQPGLLEDSIGAFRHRIDQLLKGKVTGKGEIAKRVRILQSTPRNTDVADFRKITSALVNRQRINVLYHSRSKDETSERMISLQRLIYYQDNWYLDAYCHKQQALRIFSLDRLKPIYIDEQKSLEIDKQELNDYFTQTFGIFAGQATDTAELKFSDTAARWVADEKWHPNEKGEVQRDGSYILKVPYGNPTELIQEILKYGDDVEVLSPLELREQIREILLKTLEKYQK